MKVIVWEHGFAALGRTHEASPFAGGFDSNSTRTEISGNEAVITFGEATTRLVMDRHEVRILADRFRAIAELMESK